VQQKETNGVMTLKARMKPIRSNINRTERKSERNIKKPKFHSRRIFSFVNGRFEKINDRSKAEVTLHVFFFIQRSIIQTSPVVRQWCSVLWLCVRVIER